MQNFEEALHRLRQDKRIDDIYMDEDETLHVVTNGLYLHERAVETYDDGPYNADRKTYLGRFKLVLPFKDSAQRIDAPYGKPGQTIQKPFYQDLEVENLDNKKSHNDKLYDTPHLPVQRYGTRYGKAYSCYVSYQGPLQRAYINQDIETFVNDYLRFLSEYSYVHSQYRQVAQEWFDTQEVIDLRKQRITKTKKQVRSSELLKGLGI